MIETFLITGPSSGFGKEVALLFKSKGWNVADTMRTPDKAESWTRAAGLFTPKLDVTDRASMKTAIDQTIEKFGKIDVLANNAGFALMGPLEGASAEDLKKQFYIEKSLRRKKRTTMKKSVSLLILTFVVAGLFIFVAVVKFKYGTGKEYPDIGANLPTESFSLEKLIPMEYPPGNLAVANNGDVYFNYHPLAKAERFSEATVFKWSNGKVEPFPSLEAQKNFQGTFGMTIDKQNRIWFIEPAALDFKHTRVSAFDLNTKRRVEFFEFPEGQAQYAEDIRITADGKHIILPNPGLFNFTTPSIVVYSVLNHTFHSIKSDHPCLTPEDWIIQTPYGPDRLLWGLINFAVGIDGIEISEDQKWLYMASMTNSRLCRAPMSVVLSSATTTEGFNKSIEDIGKKPQSDGIAIDRDGRVIITDVEHGAIMAFNPTTNQLSKLGGSNNIVWPDGVAVGSAGDIYFTDSSIPSYIDQLVRPPSKSKLLEHRPYFIYRLKKSKTLKHQ